MKYIRKRLMLGSALVALALLFAVARTHAFQEWYRTVTVQGRVTMLLVDENGKVDGLLLESGEQVRLSPRMADAAVTRVKIGDTVAVTGRGGRQSSYGRLVRAVSLSANGQTLTAVDEPRPEPPPGPHGPAGPQRGHVPPPHDAPAPRPDHPPVPPPPPAGAPPVPADPAAGPTPLPPPAIGPATVAPPSGPEGPAVPPPIESRPVTARGTVQAFLVGAGGEVIGLALSTGEQIRFPPRVGEALIAQSSTSHPEVTVEGQARKGEHGTSIRPDRLTVGTQTLIVR